MAKLPYSRVINVSLSREDAFPSRRGFGTPIVLTTTSVVDVLDAAIRTKAYGSMDEVAVDWQASDDFYKAAEAAFSQNPRPLLVKAGYVAVDTATDADAIKDQLDAILAYDTDWYWITIDSTMRDEAYLDGLIEWTEAQRKIAIIDSNDDNHEVLGDTTNISARHKGEVERTGVFYHPDAEEWGGAALAARLCTFNFDQPNSAYTAKFKRLNGVSTIDRASAAVGAITGFTPALGQSTTAGHCANTYVDIGDRDFVVEGSTLTPNVFIDEIHASDWIVSRIEEQTLGILLNNDRVPYDNSGMELLASASRAVMQAATRAGLVASDLNPETGLYEPAVEITVPSVFEVSADQRKARIAPPISVRFRYAGATHYVTVNIGMRF